MISTNYLWLIGAVVAGAGGVGSVIAVPLAASGRARQVVQPIQESGVSVAAETEREKGKEEFVTVKKDWFCFFEDSKWNCTSVYEIPSPFSNLLDERE